MVTLYTPAIKDFSQIVINKKIQGLTSLVICFEDAIDISDLPMAENNALNSLDNILKAIDCDKLSYEEIPMIFFRVRSINQFKAISERLSEENLKLLAGFVFPKFFTGNGVEYFSYLKMLNESTNEILYGMPILEGSEIAFKDTRYKELIGIKEIVDKYKELVLNIRVGATDFSSCFGVRRGIDYSIYDILTVKDCLTDILNIFGRNNEYVISGPVWEYFLASKKMQFKENLDFSLQSSLLKRKRIVNEAIDGLLREVILDKANGFIGKTVIHPTHIKYVNAMQAVTEEEYADAIQILNTHGGVIKSISENKMNEISPHRSWAQKIYNKAKVYGVIKDEASYIKLVSKGDFNSEDNDNADK